MTTSTRIASLILLDLCLLLFAVAPQSAVASYGQRQDAMHFAREMEQKHGFDALALLAILDRARHQQRVISLIKPPAQPGTRSWQRYRSRFLSEARIADGVAFWATYASALSSASARFGVPPEVIIAIIGVETNYGSHTGNFETLSVLATLAFDYPPRAPLFRRELESLLLLAREQQRDPFSYTGSYAGALGYPQFLPSSIRSYAVDFNNDGRVDLDSDPLDAIGSVANYLAAHGWIEGGPIATRVRLPPDLDPTPLIDAGIEPTLSAELIAAHAIGPTRGTLAAAPSTLVDLVTPGEQTEYWLGYRNFYVITRYNRSSFYAMSVLELAEAIRTRAGLAQSAAQ